MEGGKARPQNHGGNVGSTIEHPLHPAMTPYDDWSALNSVITSIPTIDTPTGHPPGATPYLPPAHAPRSVSSAGSRQKILWQTAYVNLKNDPTNASLVKKYDAILEKTTNNGLDTEEKMREILRIKMEEVKKKEWTIGTINIRDQVNRILKIVEFAKDFGSAAASLDPVHAGLPWAAVCMILPLVMNDSLQHAAVRDGLEEISAIKARYAATLDSFEDFEDHLPLDKFQEAVIELYGEILKYQATAVVDFARGSISRVSRNLIKVDNWTSFLEKIRSLDTVCEKLAGVVQARDQQARAVSLANLLKDQSSIISALIQTMKKEEAKNKTILQWYSTFDHENAHHAARKRLVQYPHTGKWLLDHSRYQAWSQVPDSSVLSISGPVGTGKTSLMSAVIENLSTFKNSGSGVVLAFFYCSSKGTITTPADVVRSLIVQTQLSNTNSFISPCVRNLYERKSTRSSGPHVEESCKVLSQLIEEFGEITLAIDALDECADPIELLRALRDTFSTVNASQGMVRMICSSQMHIEASKVLGGAGIHCESIIVTSKDTLGDMNAYITREVRSRRDEDRLLEGARPDLEDRLVEILTRKAEGMFQWVRLQLELFLNSRYATQVFTNALDLAERLELLDSQSLSGLESLILAYDQIYERNVPPGQPRNQILAERTLSWILGSVRPLEISELAFAVGIDPDHEENSSPTPAGLLLRICGNLVTIDQDGTVQLAHLSVKDYLLGRAGNTYGEIEVATQISQTCLSYLYYNPVIDAESERRHLGSFTFANYAIRYWPYHCSQVTSDIRQTRLKRLLTQFLGWKRSRLFLAWFKIWYDSATQTKWMPEGSLTSDPQTVLFLAAGFGFKEVIDLFSDNELLKFSKGPRSDSSWILNRLDRPRHYSVIPELGPSTCLQLAAQNDRSDFIEHLLHKRKLHVLLETQYPGRRGESPLCKAARMNRLWAASVLIQAGAKQEWQQAVKAARSKEMLEWLAYAQTDEQERNRGMHRAICSGLGLPNWSGALEISMNLIGPTRNHRMWSLPSHSLNQQTRLLLQQPWVGMALQSDLEEKASLIFVALVRRNFEALERLLNAGANPRALCRWGRSPVECSTLQLAVTLSACEPQADTARVVRLLLDRGAVPNWQNAGGLTPLHVAAQVDDVAVVKALLRAGARKDIKSAHSETAWHVAREYGCTNVLSVLGPPAEPLPLQARSDDNADV